jgi:hypothetical protein
MFFTLVKLLKIENTFSFQLDVADQLLLVLLKLKLNLLFNDLARRFGISKGLANTLPSPPFYFYFSDLLVCTTARIVLHGNQTTKP